MSRKLRDENDLEPKGAFSQYGLAVSLDRQKKFDEALKEYQKVIELVPKFSVAYLDLGVILYRQRRLNEAIENYRKAVEMDSTLAGAFYELGHAQHDQAMALKGIQAVRKFDEAINNLLKARHYSRQNAMILYNLGVVFFHQAHALASFETGRRGWPDTKDLILASPKVQRKLEEASNYLNRAIALYPGFTPASSKLRDVMLAQGRRFEPNRSVKNNSLVPKEPRGRRGDSTAYVKLGFVLQDQGKLEEAKICHKKAIRLYPECFSKIAFLLYFQGRYQEAILHLQKAIDFHPDNEVNYGMLGDSLKRLGRYAEGEEVHKKGKEIKARKNR